jgi:hypothetical protein
MTSGESPVPGPGSGGKPPPKVWPKCPDCERCGFGPKRRGYECCFLLTFEAEGVLMGPDNKPVPGPDGQPIVSHEKGAKCGVALVMEKIMGAADGPQRGPGGAYMLGG